MGYFLFTIVSAIFCSSVLYVLNQLSITHLSMLIVLLPIILVLGFFASIVAVLFFISLSMRGK